MKFLSYFSLWLACTTAHAWADPLSRIAFGSCCKQDRPAPIFHAISASRPQLFIWLGDNIYGDSPDPAILKAKYQQLAGHPDYAAIRGKIPVIGTWDDHDYGKNDAGKEFEARDEAQTAFLDFFEVPANSPRRSRKGVYSCQDYGPADQQVRVILLDVRFHRDAPGADGDILGEEQWKWLEERLLESEAKVHLIGTGIQFLANGHRFEKWGNFPPAHARMLKLLARPEVPPVIFLSGDRHLAEISLNSTDTGYPLYDITSSSLNAPFGGSKDEINPLRVGPNFRKANSGSINIDWGEEPPLVTLAVRDLEGAPQRAVTFTLSR